MGRGRAPQSHTGWPPRARPRPDGARTATDPPLWGQPWQFAGALCTLAVAVLAIAALRGGAPAPVLAATNATITPATPAAATTVVSQAKTPAGSATATTRPASGAASGAAAAPSAKVTTTANAAAPATTATSTAKPTTTTKPTTTALSAAGATATTVRFSTTVPVAGSQCGDPAGDPGTAGLSEIDLTNVDLTRDPRGLTVRFRLLASVQPEAVGADGAAANNRWQLMIANGDTLIYSFTVTQSGASWASTLVDVGDPSGNRQGGVTAPKGRTVEALIPADALRRLPATFTWWALSTTDRASAADDCPNGTGATSGSATPPSEPMRSTFSS